MTLASAFPLNGSFQKKVAGEIWGTKQNVFGAIQGNSHSRFVAWTKNRANEDDYWLCNAIISYITKYLKLGWRELSLRPWILEIWINRVSKKKESI